MTDLELKFEQAKAQLAAMTPAEREAMFAQQRAGYARAEASWPKPVYEWVDGVKVYASYADYCND
jgi:hypothetical protein